MLYRFDNTQRDGLCLSKKDNIVVYISVTTVTSFVSCEEMTPYIFTAFMARQFILQTAVVCAISQEREISCSFVQWNGGN